MHKRKILLIFLFLIILSQKAFSKESILESKCTGHLQKEPEKCLNCHENVKILISEVKYKHGDIKQEDCIVCHEVNITDSPFKLKKSLKDICFGCHSNLKTKINNSKSVHQPIQEGLCPKCHEPHGANNRKLLKRYYENPFFYVDNNPLSHPSVTLCWECHKKDIIKEVETITITDFRNGNNNLHYTHINKKKGRTCLSCHDAHTSNQEKLMRDEVPFSPYWSYKIEFIKTQTGGGCITGCHKPRSYDRERPVAVEE